MKKNVYSLLFFTSVLMLLLGTAPLIAQVTFTVNTLDTVMGIRPNPGTGNTGCAWGDYNGDGLLDLWIGGGPNRSCLYINDCGPGGTGLFYQAHKDFPNMAGALFDTIGYTLGGFWADMDNDDDLDLVHVNNGAAGANISYWKNDGPGNGYSFTYASKEAGLLSQDYAPLGSNKNLWQIAAGDYDQDGDLDFILAGTDATRQNTCILKNDGGIFSNVRASALALDLYLESWNPQWVDIDNDGDLDAFLPTVRTKTAGTAPANTIEPCAILRNDGNGEFTKSDSTTIGIQVWSAVVSTIADIDNDGDMDIYVIPISNDGGAPIMMRNNTVPAGLVDGWPTFTNITTPLGLDSTAFNNSRGINFGDFDNDGDLDLLMGIRRAWAGAYLYRNDGDIFTEVSATTGANVTIFGDDRTVCFVDYNNDGFLDIYEQGSGTNKKGILRNGGNSNHWIGIIPKCVTANNNKSGIGARFTLYAGSTMQIRDIQAGGGGGLINGYLRAHFGLGAGTTIDSIAVRWPDGTREIEKRTIAVDKYYTFTEGAGLDIEVGIDDIMAGLPKQFELKDNYPNPFNPTTKIAYSLPTATKVRIEVIDVLGRIVATLVNEAKQAGEYSLEFEGSKLGSGVYMYRLTTPEVSITKKMMLVK